MAPPAMQKTLNSPSVLPNVWFSSRSICRISRGKDTHPIRADESGTDTEQGGTDPDDAAAPPIITVAPRFLNMDVGFLRTRQHV